MIEVRDVTKTHTRGDTQIHALRNLSCVVPEGTFTFIVGPSGSGKSSLLYLLGALDEPTSGNVFFDRRSLASFSTSERDDYRRSTVGFVFQSFNLLANLTAIENVLVPFMPRGVTKQQRQEAADLLSTVGLAARLEHKPRQLSGGEQQRVAIARALLKHPRVILADEPTGELDSDSGTEVFTYLRRMHEQHNTTVVVVTHDERYLTSNDNVLRMQDGRLADQPPID